MTDVHIQAADLGQHRSAEWVNEGQADAGPTPYEIVESLTLDRDPDDSDDVPCPQDRDCGQDPTDAESDPVESVRALTDRLDAQSAQLRYVVARQDSHSEQLQFLTRSMQWLTNTINGIITGFANQNPILGAIVKRAMKSPEEKDQTRD